MRVLAFTLAALTVLIQYPLWFGKGGWLRVAELERQVEAQRSRNAELAARNAVRDAEVRDLKQGLDVVEELARFQLGMVRKDEVFFQIVEPRHGSAH
jgi:cell division protein FtsB